MEDDEHLEKYEEGFKGRLAGRERKVSRRRSSYYNPFCKCKQNFGWKVWKLLMKQ